MSYQDRATEQVLIDGFGEGCLGGAGRIPKTYKAPTSIADAPFAEQAGDIKEPWPGFFGCIYNDAGDLLSCWAGDIDGGTIMAFDTEDLTWDNFGKPLLTLFYVDFLGTMGFLYAAADLSGLIDPANPETFPGCYAAFMADAVGTLFGGFLGTSSVTTYGESMAGVYEGGRTGLTALVIAFFNFICMFLAPFFSAIPTISTGPALVMVGVFMIEGVKDIDWADYMQAIPSLVCILLQITTYKIEVGIIGALFVWAFMMVVSLRFLLYIPGCYKALPAGLQKFIANQQGDAAFKAKVAELGGEPSKNSV
jgi:xanthine/uracil/vitamin C permease (AzgA family)